MIRTSKKRIYASLAVIFTVILTGFLISYNGPAEISFVADAPDNTYAEKQSISEQESKPEQKQTPPESANNLIRVSFKAGEGTYEISVEKGTSVYGAMEKLASVSPLKFNSVYYSGLGYFVDSINGIKNKNGYYWTLFVNGKYSNIGASDYNLSDGDQVEWKYTNEPNN